MECGLSAYAFASRYGIYDIQKPRYPLSNITRQINTNRASAITFQFLLYTNHTKLHPHTHRRMDWNKLKKKKNNGFNVAAARKFISIKNNIRFIENCLLEKRAQWFELKKKNKFNAMKYKMNNADTHGEFYLKQISNELYIYFQIQVKCRKFFKNRYIKLYMISSKKKFCHLNSHIQTLRRLKNQQSFKVTFEINRKIRENLNQFFLNCCLMRMNK